MNCLVRQFHTFNVNEVVVVINTLDELFKSKAVQCKEDLSCTWDWLVPLLNTLNSFIGELPIRQRLKEVVDPYYEVNKQ